MQELISVIVPVYNVEQYLERCLRSVLCQTYENLELILVDDGSKDNSGAICDRFAAEDKRIVVIHQKNAGVSAARHAALAVASGAFLMFVDSDDYLTEDAVQILYERMQRDGSDMAIGKHMEVYDDGSWNDDFCSWMEDGTYSGIDVLKRMGEENHFAVAVWGKLYKKDLFNGVTFPRLVCGEDLCALSEVLEKASLVSSVASNVYCYYQRATSVVHVHNERTKHDELVAKVFMTKQLLKHGLWDAAAKWFDFSIFRAFWLQDAKEARRILKENIDKNTTRKLLQRQTLKTRILWLAVYVPLLKTVVTWKISENQRRREAA